MKKQIVLSTELFGSITFDAVEGICEDYIINLCGKEIETTLLIWEKLITEQNEKTVVALLENITSMYQKARNEIENNFDTNPFISYFIQCHIEDLEEDCLLEYFEVEDLEEITPKRFIEKLEPRAICIEPTVDEAGVNCIFDFSIDENISDELLVIIFNQNLEIEDITHES